MTHIYKTKTPIFKTSLAFIYYTDPKDVKLCLEGDEDLKDLQEFSDDLEEGPAVVLTQPGTNAVIAFFRLGEAELDRFLITHEAMHAAWGTVRGIGVPSIDDSEEVIAYLQEYYTELFEQQYKEATAAEQKFVL